MFQLIFNSHFLIPNYLNSIVLYNLHKVLFLISLTCHIMHVWVHT